MRSDAGLPLSGAELGYGPAERVLIGTGAGEVEAHAAGVSGEDGADLEELEADGGDLGAGHVGTLEPSASDRGYQDIGEAGRAQTLAVRAPGWHRRDKPGGSFLRADRGSRANAD